MYLFHQLAIRVCSIISFNLPLWKSGCTRCWKEVCLTLSVSDCILSSFVFEFVLHGHLIMHSVHACWLVYERIISSLEKMEWADSDMMYLWWLLIVFVSLNFFSMFHFLLLSVGGNWHIQYSYSYQMIATSTYISASILMLAFMHLSIFTILSIFVPSILHILSLLHCIGCFASFTVQCPCIAWNIMMLLLH